MDFPTEPFTTYPMALLLSNEGAVAAAAYVILRTLHTSGGVRKIFRGEEGSGPWLCHVKHLFGGVVFIDRTPVWLGYKPPERIYYSDAGANFFVDIESVLDAKQLVLAGLANTGVGYNARLSLRAAESL